MPLGDFMYLDKTTEEKTCQDVLNLWSNEAVQLIRERGLVDRVIWQDGKDLSKSDSCYISHRINLKVKKGKIISAMIG
jgi:hypothetical protein